MRTFLDTNVLVSAYTARGTCADLVRHILAEHELLTGEVNLAELARVLKDLFHAPAVQLANVDAELREQTIVPKPAASTSVPVRDPDDGWVLASAVAGGAELLVTGDGDLLAVAEQSPVPIVSPRGCWERLRG
ncbi:MAG: putative toxin-antitoxin system toxin component, PIN family [Gemmatimonadaceae bacterium]|nr:putative toxin-antitoxin system toxin component, PIN family [Gemmatimonadaceae bacterium]